MDVLLPADDGSLAPFAVCGRVVLKDPSDTGRHSKNTSVLLLFICLVSYFSMTKLNVGTLCLFSFVKMYFLCGA